MGRIVDTPLGRKKAFFSTERSHFRGGVINLLIARAKTAWGKQLTFVPPIQFQR
jgi:hypothetical protein